MGVYTQNAIYDYVYGKVISEFPNAYISGMYEPVVSSFPAIFIREIGEVHSPSNVTFGGAQGVRISTFEVQIQSNSVNSPKTEAYSIYDIVKQAFMSLFYIQESMTILSEGDREYFRIRASFRRVIGSADEMPESE